MKSGSVQLERKRDVFQGIQEKHNYLPEVVLRELAKEKNISLMDIYSVATFYKSFSLEPRGKHNVTVCSGTACHVRGSDKVKAETAEEGEEKGPCQCSEAVAGARTKGL